MTDSENITKRRFWRRVLIVGILVVLLALLILVSLYLSGVSDAMSQDELVSGLELEIAVLSARSGVLFNAAKWTIPFAILGSLVMNIARYKLRKLKTLKNLHDSTH